MPPQSRGHFNRKTRTLLILAAAACILLAPGCKRRKPVVVGSKSSTEQIILGEIIAQHVENRLHEPVARRLNLGVTSLVHESLAAGEIDVYPEYSGVAQAAILRLNVFPETQVVFDRVREVYKSNLQLDWLNPLGFITPGVMVIRKDDAQKYNLDTLSDAEKSGVGWALGTTYDFQQRADGMAALSRTYRLVSLTSPVVMDLAHLYQALDRKQVTMIPGNVTDGFLDPKKYKALRDDRSAFPPYQPSIVVRSQTETRLPALRPALDELSGKITQDEMREMNRAVDISKRTPAQVATEFLRRAGLK
jgi:glycine betaine/choline ABC-type transport system substrate-binding protein